MLEAVREKGGGVIGCENDGRQAVEELQQGSESRKVKGRKGKEAKEIGGQGRDGRQGKELAEG